MVGGAGGPLPFDIGGGGGAGARFIMLPWRPPTENKDKTFITMDKSFTRLREFQQVSSATYVVADFYSDTFLRTECRAPEAANIEVIWTCAKTGIRKSLQRYFRRH